MVIIEGLIQHPGDHAWDESVPVSRGQHTTGLNVRNLILSSPLLRENKLECLSRWNFLSNSNTRVKGRSLPEWSTMLCLTGVYAFLAISRPGVNLIKLFGHKFNHSFESYTFSKHRKIMVTLIQWSSFPNSVTKFTPKKFYAIDPRLKRFAKRTVTSAFICLHRHWQRKNVS